VAIENPNEGTLKATQKRQNTHRSIADSIHKIMRHGMIVNAGYIMGFDTEKEDVAQAILDSIEATSIPVNMVGLLFALPNTQLTKRLKLEGRLDENFDVPPDQTACQTVAGLNYTTLRPRFDILRDFRRVVDETLLPEKYFNRVLRLVLMQDCSKNRMRMPLKHHLRDIRSFFRLIVRLGMPSNTRPYFWKVFGTCLFKNPKAIRNAVSLMALYLHFGPFRGFVLGRLDTEMSTLVKDGDPRVNPKLSTLLNQPFSTPVLNGKAV